MTKKIIISDTTLRDGEQSPGASMNAAEKLRIARMLECLGVDVIEAGFPTSSKGDFDAVKMIANEIKNCQIMALARATKEDIDQAWEAIREAKNPRIHTFIATSDIHLDYKLKISREEAVRRAVAAVKHAKSYTENIQFSAEDGSRSDRDFLCEIFAAVIKAGATTINLPDTVGYAIPSEFGELVRYVLDNTEGIKNVAFSVHCHNDLGLATANTLAAIAAGATQVEVTMNGIGERAGNTALEEVVMAIKTRGEMMPVYTGTNTERIMATSETVRSITGITVQPNKAIVGANAFAHESGIHQDGVLKNPMTYEIMRPEDVGLSSNRISLGPRSGKSAVRDELKKIGFVLSDDEFKVYMEEFLKLADKKKDITNSDLEALVIAHILRGHDEIYSLNYLQVTCGTVTKPVANVHVAVDGRIERAAIEGTGPVDAVFNTIASITKKKPILSKFRVGSVTKGTDAQANVTVEFICGDITVYGRSSDTDIIVASAKAYLNGLNRILHLEKNPLPRGTEPVSV
jgi:2-isopropylmalate synthase